MGIVVKSPSKTINEQPISLNLYQKAASMFESSFKLVDLIRLAKKENDPLRKVYS